MIAPDTVTLIQAAQAGDKEACGRLVEENRHGNWYVRNGNRILIKKKQFEKFMDKTDAI